MCSDARSRHLPASHLSHTTSQTDEPTRAPPTSSTRRGGRIYLLEQQWRDQMTQGFSKARYFVVSHRLKDFRLKGQIEEVLRDLSKACQEQEDKMGSLPVSGTRFGEPETIY
jgi:hypothetical protein